MSSCSQNWAQVASALKVLRWQILWVYSDLPLLDSSDRIRKTCTLHLKLSYLHKLDFLVGTCINKVSTLLSCVHIVGWSVGFDKCRPDPGGNSQQCRTTKPINNRTVLTQESSIHTRTFIFGVYPFATEGWSCEWESCGNPGENCQGKWYKHSCKRYICPFDFQRTVGGQCKGPSLASSASTQPETGFHCPWTRRNPFS